MRNAGPVQTLAFGDSVKESDDFAHVHDMGGTATHKAIEKASEWLSSQSGNRWIVLVTDGMPNVAAWADDACRKAAANGIRILTIGIGCTIKMAESTSVTAADPAHLAIELDAAAQMIERA